MSEEKVAAFFMRAKKGVSDEELSKMVNDFFDLNSHKLEGANYFALKSRVSGLKLINTLKKLASKHSIGEEDLNSRVGGD